MTLENWDKTVRPHLNFISAGAEMAARHARQLPLRPEWETNAQSHLAEARAVLESALASIAAAEAAYAETANAA